MAYAIYTALFDISTLVGSTTHVIAISNANPGLVTTDLNTGFLGGEAISITGANPSVYNGNYAVLDVPTEKTFHLGTAYPANSITALSWSGGTNTATMTTLTAHGVTPGSSFTIVGVSAGAWNGTYVAAMGCHTDSAVWPRWRKLISETSSIPPALKGLQRSTRQAARIVPLTGPTSRIAAIA